MTNDERQTTNGEREPQSTADERKIIVIERMLTTLRRRFQRPIVSLYIDQDRIVVTDVQHDRRDSYATRAVVEGDIDNVNHQCSVIRWLRKQYSSRRGLIVLYSTPCASNDSMEHRTQIYEYARKRRCEVLFFEFATCSAIGADIDIADFRKVIVAYVTDSTIQMKVYFAGGVGFQRAHEHYREDRLGEMLEQQVHALKNTVPRDLPKLYNRPGFPKEELLTGWHKGYSEEIFVIFLGSPLELPTTVSGHGVVGIADGVSCAERGLERFLEEVSDSENRSLYLQLVRYNYLAKDLGKL